MFSLLAGGASLLRCQHEYRGRFREEEVFAGARGLLRVFASQEGGWSRKAFLGAVKHVLTLSVPPQATRVHALQSAYRRAEASNPRDGVPKAGAIRNLGLLDKDEDTKAVLGK